MWLFTPEGMFSVSRWNDQLQFRAFAKADLERLAKAYGLEHYGITETPERDYHYRIMLPPAVAQRVIGEMAARIDYSNLSRKPQEYAGKIDTRCI